MGSTGLVSVRCIQAAGGVVSFAGNTVSIKHGRELYSITKLEQNAYILQTENIEAKPASAGIATMHGTLHDWHCRLGHISYDNVKMGAALILLVLVVLLQSKPAHIIISPL